jgi:hypothetical protein
MSDIMNECRICFEIESDDDPFIQPCACKGTSKYIHLTCLEKWRNQAENQEARDRCMECRDDYIIAKEFPLEIYPFHNTNIMSDDISKCFRNNLLGVFFCSFCLYLVDSTSQTSLVIFSFGNNWYINTIGKSINEGDELVTISYYIALGSFVNNICIMMYYYCKIYQKIERRMEFYNFIKYELIFLNLLIPNFLYILWGCNTIGQDPYSFFIVIVFLLMSASSNSLIPPALIIITKSSIKYVNTKRNPETILNVQYNPLNTVIEMGGQKYEELVASDLD